MLCHHGFLSICICTCMSIMAVFIKIVLFIDVLYTMFTTIQSAEQTLFQDKLTWFEAQRCCESRSGQLATINDEIVNCKNIPQRDSSSFKIWTGDIQKHSEWIEFQGCYRLSGIPKALHSISHCYKRCSNLHHNAFEHFAFKEGACICNPTMFEEKHGLNILCSKSYSRNYLWFYKVLHNATYDGYGNCVASKCTSGPHKTVAVSCVSLNIPKCGLSNTNKESSSAKNLSKWTESLSICKDQNFEEYNATDICESNKHTTETGMWMNIFRVEISAHADHADKINITDVSSCLIANCSNNAATSNSYYINCNETADGFFCLQDISKASVKIKHTRTVSASTTKLNGNCVSKSTTYSSFLGNGITSAKLPGGRSLDVSATRSPWPPYATADITPAMDQHVRNKPNATNIGLICGVTVGGVVLIAVIVIITCKMRKIGPFRKQLYNEDNVEMNNSIDCAKPVYHDTVLNTGNGSVPKDVIRNNIGENRSTNVYAVLVKKRPAGSATQPGGVDLEEDENQSQRFETEDEYDTLKHTVDKGEEEIENNVYDSSLGVCDGIDLTYNSIKICQVNNDTTYDHTSNVVQKQVNSDTTYDHTSNIVQKQVNNDTTYDHTY